MNTTFERSATATDEWYTPKEIIDALGAFDLDPCAPVNPLWETADIMYNKNDNGLSKEWFGRVWLNPPYSRPLIERFVKRLAEHGNGIALLFNRCDSKMFQDVIFEKATAMKFLRNRIRFFRPDGTRGDSPGCGSILIAFGEENAEVLKDCDIAGKYVRINQTIMERKEFKIGEEFQFGRIKLRVEKCDVDSCENCFFAKYRVRCYLIEEVGSCTEIGRTDGTSVKFVKVEEDENRYRI